MPTLTIERRLAALEANGVRSASCITVRHVTEGGTPEEQAEHAAMRAAGVDLIVVNLVSAKPRPETIPQTEEVTHV